MRNLEWILMKLFFDLSNELNLSMKCIVLLPIPGENSMSVSW